MSARNWPVGTVAAVTIYREEFRAIRTPTGWSTAYGHSDREPQLADITDVRPLLVLDPDDTEQMQTLAKAFTERWGNRGSNGDAMAAAVRALTDPKPPEPQGLGAVVRDRGGDQWVLINVTGPDAKPQRQWRVWWGNRGWHDIDAVEVLSEGVASC